MHSVGLQLYVHCSYEYVHSLSCVWPTQSSCTDVRTDSLSVHMNVNFVSTMYMVDEEMK